MVEDDGQAAAGQGQAHLVAGAMESIQSGVEQVEAARSDPV